MERHEKTIKSTAWMAGPFGSASGGAGSIDRSMEHSNGSYEKKW
jgi:hypothetical protein